MTLLDIDGKVLQDFGRNMGRQSACKKGFDESTHISQEASQSQDPGGAHQGLHGREGVAPARYCIGSDAGSKSRAPTQAEPPF